MRATTENRTISANQLFPTPPGIVGGMVKLAQIEPGMSALEPSAGTGRILDQIHTACTVAIEINPALTEELRRRHPNVQVICEDFLKCLPQARGTFDRIIMNPPFENGADIKHILHAQTFLKPGGRLVAICANGPRQADKLRPIADTWEELPGGTFEGTNVRAVLLTINAPKPKKDQMRLSCMQCKSEDVTYYDGALGYEAIRCNKCNEESDINSPNHGPRPDRQVIGNGIIVNAADFNRKMGPPAPMLGQDAQEAQRILYAGRKTELLREPKIFDDTTLERMPVFEKAGKQGRLL